jgi:hypothetical protein
MRTQDKVICSKERHLLSGDMQVCCAMIQEFVGCGQALEEYRIQMGLAWQRVLGAAWQYRACTLDQFETPLI